MLLEMRCENCVQLQDENCTVACDTGAVSMGLE